MRIGVLAVALVVLTTSCDRSAPSVALPEASMSMTVSSTAFTDGGTIPRRYTCDGENISPPLRVEGVPSGTRQLALLVEDPDAPGGTFVHWVAWGIDPAGSGLGEGEAPPGSGVNGFGKRGYGGPCPPRGPAHRYVFTVLALSEPPTLAPGSSADDLRKAVASSVLGEGRLVGRYARA
jgi:Raf kinase inhibitor-like YbhB/YbcL family protein